MTYVVHVLWDIKNHVFMLHLVFYDMEQEINKYFVAVAGLKSFLTKHHMDINYVLLSLL